MLELGRWLVDDVVEQLEDGHRLGLDQAALAGRVVLGALLEDEIEGAGVGRRDRVHADGHLDEGEAQGPDVRLDRVVGALEAFGLEGRRRRTENVRRF